MDEGVRKAIFRFLPHLKSFETGSILSRSESITVVLVNCEVVVKYGPGVRNAELNALKLAKTSSTAPVPQVYGHHRDEAGCLYIVMEYLNGESLFGLWRSLTDIQKHNFASKLKECFRELHDISGTYIGGVGRYPAQDVIFKGASDKGPFESEQQLNDVLVRAHRARWSARGGNPPESYVLGTLPWLPSDHRIVLSHGQVDKDHVLVDMEKGEITGLVGWSRAGFFPEHWGFVNALVCKNWFMDWIEYIPIILKPYYEEYALWFRIRQMSFGL